MDDKRINPKTALDAAIDTVRTTEPDRTEMEDRAARVWARIGQELSPESATTSNVEQIRSCGDYRALIPDYIAGRLSPARALLFTDHIHECVACRKALAAARGAESRPVRAKVKQHPYRPVAIFATAAALVAGIALQQAGYLNFLLPVVKVNAMARTIDGRLYNVTGVNMNPVQAGAALKAGVPVRTAADSRAVIELADGTHIEMRERSQLSLTG